MKPFELFFRITILCVMLVGTSVFLKYHFIKYPLAKQATFQGLYLSFFQLLSSPWAWLACLCGVSGAIIWMIILNKVELSLAYPMVSFSYVLMAIVSFLLFHENLSIYKVIGILMICCGMLVMNR